MRVLRSLSDVRAADRGAVICIGNFDGVHRGHRAVLNVGLQDARMRGVPAGVLLFDPHPRRYFRPEQALFTITPMPLRLRLLASLGLDFALVMPFDAVLAELPAESFVDHILVGGLGVGRVVVGYDFNFGKDRRGSPNTLTAAGREAGFDVGVVPATSAGDGEPVFSSTRIRDCLKAGDMRQAADLLGYWWRASGLVVSGAQRGTGLGFPTANIALLPDQDIKHGIYAARVWVGADRHHAASYFGTRPTFDGGPPLLETFLLDFDDNLYGRTIDVELIEFMRGDMAFTNIDALKQQMAIDCAEARQLLRRLETTAGSPQSAFLPALSA